MHRRGETIIVVPFWWDGYNKRPELLAGTHQGSDDGDIFITTLNPDIHRFKDMIPDIGELMLASFPLVIFNVSHFGDEHFWWLGEKYDGLRVVWNPIRRCFNYRYSRYAYEIAYPYPKHLSNSVFLDGEIWFGRGQFVEVQKFINNDEIEWGTMRMVIFDNASPSTRRSPFESRYAQLVFDILPNNPLIISMQQETRVACKSEELISFFTNTIIIDHGEGVIMRKPSSRYVSGRSRYLCKLKATRGDAEGLVTEADKRDGWLQLQLPNGRTIRIQHQKSESVQPKRGDIVSFIYDNFSPRSTPVNPKIERVRTDLTWENVVRQFQKAKSESLKLNEHSSRVFGKRRQIPTHKDEERKREMRLFFTNYAENKGFNPLDPSNWYYSDQIEMRKLQGAHRILKYYSGSMMRALLDLFPNVKFDKTKFRTIPQANRRSYIIKYAASKGFDALLAKNWYKANVTGFIKTKGLASVVWYYGGSFTRALLHLFPEIGIEKSKLRFRRKSIGKLNLRTVESRKNFFEKFASRRAFDPLEPTSWYQVNIKQLEKERGYNTVLTHYCGSLVRALTTLFPTIGLEPKRFAFLAKNMYKDPQQRREFFVRLARERAFDPLISSNWYPIKKKDLTNVKGIYGVLSFHNENVHKALCDLFPEIGLDKNMFGIVQRHYWSDSYNRRNYFMKFASEHAFDPLIAENWYKYKRGDIPKHHVLQYHKHTLATALADLFPNIGLDLERFSK